MIEISRGTKCFPAYHGKDIDGAFPHGFMEWLRKSRWIDGDICFLCSGRISEQGFKVDINPKMNPDLVSDASDTGLPEEEFDTVIIDPPYSKNLAQKLYGTETSWHSINLFVKEGIRIVRIGGTVISLSYEIPKKPKNANIIAVWGIYTVPATAYMRCLAVFQKAQRAGETRELVSEKVSKGD